MDIRYTLLDPTGNITVLAEGDVAPEKQPEIAAKLSGLEPTSEQTGFISEMRPGVVTMRMAGGEFCGNAAMSAAVLCADRYGESSVEVKFLGADVSVKVQAVRASDRWIGAVEMPEPISIEDVDFPDGRRLPVVFLPGIGHIIDDSGAVKHDEAEKLCREWCRYLEADAVGIMMYDGDEGRLTPLVYVPTADTLFWESSCASGTTALGYWLCRNAGGPIYMPISEPGGILTVDAEPESRLTLTGTVKIVHTKNINIEL